jgi:hypothetical protein
VTAILAKCDAVHKTLDWWAGQEKADAGIIMEICSWRKLPVALTPAVTAFGGGRDDFDDRDEA